MLFKKRYNEDGDEVYTQIFGYEESNLPKWYDIFRRNDNKWGYYSTVHWSEIKDDVYAGELHSCTEIMAKLREASKQQRELSLAKKEKEAQTTLRDKVFAATEPVKAEPAPTTKVISKKKSKATN